MTRTVRKAKGLWISLAVVMVMSTVSLLALPAAHRWSNVQNLDTAVRHAPSITPVARLESYERTPAQAPVWIRLAHRASSWLGHDDLGRSLFYRLSPAIVLSLLVGLSAVIIAVVVGTLWGATAAMAGGRVDLLMMRLVDVLYGLPYILMVILLKIALTRPLTALIGNAKVANFVVLLVAIGGVSWLTMARVIRGQVLSLRQLAFVEAARAAGASRTYILRRHLLPNLLGSIIVYATLVLPQAILQESFLSFLGIGIQQPTPSLGNLAAEGVHAVNLYVDYWWLIVFPCGALAVLLLALNFLGDGLRDAYDPRSGASTWI